MKTKQEIEQLAFLEYPRLINDPYNPMEDDNTYERQIWIDAYTQCQEDMADKKYTEEDMLKAIEKARDIFDGKDCFTAEDVSGCTEVCTYNWKFQFSEDDIIKSLNKQD
jgi:hypothetical protein